ncbi:MAG: Gfo/Idh/MocA family oxidoreductase [Saprospiraceae bacterium]|nr:Gfo/Idh/MocA family oxidoreductase [Saprospiraceae bacterium]
MKRRQFMFDIPLSMGALNLAKFGLSAPNESKKLGVALVGLGNYSTRQLAPALMQTEHCYLAGIVTGSSEKGGKWSKEYAIPKENIYNYQNFDTIYNNPAIDIAYVVLPNSMHAEFTVRAAKAGKHVICEKPMAMNVKEAESMIKACSEAKVKLGVGYRLYHEPHHLEMRRLGSEKIYGKVKAIESSLGYAMADPQSWRLNKEMGGGGAIMDLGVYAIQGVRRTLNELPTHITAQGFVSNKNIFKNIYEMMSFQMTFPSGAVSNSWTTYSSFSDRLYATTESDWFELRPSFTAMGAKGNSSKGKIDFASPKFQQIKQLDAFAQSILNDTKPIASGEEGLIDVKIIEFIKRSADTGKPIKIAPDFF